MEINTMSKSPRTIISIDRLSNLPEHVAHRILFFLSIEDISRLSVVCKRYRQLCISSPFLNFNVTPYLHNASKRARLMDYIERFVFLRKGMEVQHCRIEWNPQISLVHYQDEEFRVLSWLQNALTCNVKHLVVHLMVNSSGPQFTLPASLLSSTSLLRLKVVFDNGIGILKTPSFFTTFGSPSFLKHLILKSVKIDESFGNWISSRCKLLRKLHLQDIKGTTCIMIISSSLEELSISSSADLLHLHVSTETLRVMGLHWTFDSPNNRILQLSTPKLKRLHWSGNILKLVVAENFTNLLSSSIFLAPVPGLISTNWNLSAVIHAVCNCKILQTCDRCIQELLMLGCLPISFADLLGLRIRTAATRVNLMSSLRSFLEGTPHLHSLIIGTRRIPAHITKASSPRGDMRTMRSSELQDTPLLYNLKIVVIELITQQNNELELIEYFLKNATNLKKMTLLFSANLQLDFLKEISRYENEKASSDAIVNLELI